MNGKPKWVRDLYVVCMECPAGAGLKWVKVAQQAENGEVELDRVTLVVDLALFFGTHQGHNVRILDDETMEKTVWKEWS